jgi:hypothetical protein
MECLPKPPRPEESQKDFSDDLLRGADEISEFLFGSPLQRRKIYHLAERTKIPFFRLGSILCARKTVLLDWVSQQERRHSGKAHLGN